MKRRDVLAGLSGSLAVSLTGCTLVGPGEKDCLGETWTGLMFEVFLDEITYDGDTDQWTGTCKLSVHLNYVRGSGTGIRNAGIALYDEAGHRISLLPLGDMTWEQFPEENRSEMNCGGLKQGSLTRSHEFSADQFPHYFGLWFSEINAHVIEQKTVLQYASNASTTTDVSPSDWKSRSPGSIETFPPRATSDPIIGDGITTANLRDEYRTCQPHNVLLTDSYCCDLGLQGTIELTNPHYRIKLQRAELVDDGETAAVEIAAVDYQRPPSIDCETTYIQYGVDLSFEAEPPSSIDVIHRDATGGELERTTVTR